MGSVFFFLALISPTLPAAAHKLESLNVRMEEKALDQYQEQLTQESGGNRIKMRDVFDYRGVRKK